MSIRWSFDLRKKKETVKGENIKEDQDESRHYFIFKNTLNLSHYQVTCFIVERRFKQLTVSTCESKEI